MNDYRRVSLNATKATVHLAIAAIVACYPALSSSQVLDHQQLCRAYPLIDAELGKPISGPEDLAVGDNGKTLFISAFDRLGGSDSTDGGIFKLTKRDIDEFWSGERTNPAIRLSGPDLLRPHGIDLIESEGRQTLMVINRSDDAKRRNDGFPELSAFEWDGDRLRERSSKSVNPACFPNDVGAVDHDRALLTNDHGGCGWFETAILQDVLGFSRSAVFAFDLTGTTAPSVIEDGFLFANGVSIDPASSSLWVSDTRRGMVYAFPLNRDREARSFAPKTQFELSFSPDNLNWVDPQSSLARTIDPGAGSVLVTGHESTFQLFLHFKGMRDAEGLGGYISLLNPQTGKQIPVISDPDGDVLTAPTSAVLLGDYLIVGSVASDSLTVCAMD